MEDGEHLLKYDRVTLPSGARVRAIVKKNALVGIAIRESNDRTSLIRRTLGYEEGCDNIILKGAAVDAMGLPELALARSRVGTNLSAVELIASTERREKMAPHKAKKKIKKAKTLLAGFEERMRFLLYGCDSAAAAEAAMDECKDRFIRWLKELGHHPDAVRVADPGAPGSHAGHDQRLQAAGKRCRRVPGLVEELRRGPRVQPMDRLTRRGGPPRVSSWAVSGRIPDLTRA